MIPVTLQVAAAILVSPTQGFTAIGAAGGPFSPNSESIVLSNASASQLKWGLSKTAGAAWLGTSATNGSLAAGGQVTVIVGLTATAKTEGTGVYTATITFTNASGTLAAVPFTLSVAQPLVKNGGFETGSFSGWSQSGNTAYTSVTRTSTYVHSGSYGAELGPSSSPGYLSQTIATTSGQSYKLSLWLRNPTGKTPTWFQAQWNGAAISTLQNVAATVWTNLQFTVTATSSSTVLQLGFQDDPGYLALDDISLTPVASAAVRATLKPAAGFEFAWEVSPGLTYQAQYKTNLSQPDWINLGVATTATATTFIMNDTNAVHLSPRRFYRLAVVPPP